MTEIIKERFKIEVDETLMVEQPRSNRGRPAVPAHLKRVQIRGAYRIPQWLADWVLKDGDAGKKIETALMKHFKLVAPSGDRATGATYNELVNEVLSKTSKPITGSHTNTSTDTQTALRNDCSEFQV